MRSFAFCAAAIAAAAGSTGTTMGINEKQFHDAVECFKSIPEMCNADFTSETWGCDGPAVAPACVLTLDCVAKKAAQCAPRWQASLESAANSLKLPSRRECAKRGLERLRGTSSFDNFCSEGSRRCGDDLRAVVSVFEECSGLGITMPPVVDEVIDRVPLVTALRRMQFCMAEYEGHYYCVQWSQQSICMQWAYYMEENSIAECTDLSELLPAIVEALPEPYRGAGRGVEDCTEGGFCEGEVTACLQQVRCIVEKVNSKLAPTLGGALVPIDWVPLTEDDLKMRYLTPGRDVLECLKDVQADPPSCREDAAGTQWAQCAKELDAVVEQVDKCKEKGLSIVRTNMPELPQVTIKLPRLAMGKAAVLAPRIQKCTPVALCTGDAASCAKSVDCINAVLADELKRSIAPFGQVGDAQAAKLKGCMTSMQFNWGSCEQLNFQPGSTKLQNNCATEVSVLLGLVSRCARDAGLPHTEVAAVTQTDVANWRAEWTKCNEAYEKGRPWYDRGGNSFSDFMTNAGMERMACMARATSGAFGGQVAVVADAVADAASLLPCFRALRAPGASADDVQRFATDVGRCVGKAPVMALLRSAKRADVEKRVKQRCAPDGLCAGATLPSACLEQLECAAREAGDVLGADHNPVPAMVAALRKVWDVSLATARTAECADKRGIAEALAPCAPRRLLDGGAYDVCFTAVRDVLSLLDSCGQQSGLVGPYVGPSVLPDLKAAAQDVQGVVQRADEERKRCLGGRAPCAEGDPQQCLTDVKCLMEGANKALRHDVLPVSAVPVETLRPLIDCTQSLGDLCGTSNVSDSVAATAARVTCGARVMLQCTANDDVVAESTRLTSAAASCMASNVTGCGFTEEPAEWGCIGGMKNGNTDACFEMLECTMRTTDECMAPYFAAMSRLILPASAPSADTDGSSNTNTSDDGLGALLYVLGAAAGVVLLGALALVVYKTRQARTTSFENKAGSYEAFGQHHETSSMQNVQHNGPALL